eukprot:g3065.t1
MSEPPADSLLETARAWLPLTLSAAAAIFLARFLTRYHTPLHCCRLRIWIGCVMNHLFLCHRMYIRSRRPFRIILMRHAESEGNVDKCVYSSTPDHALKITERGKRQAAIAGSELKKLVGDESVYFIVSPYTRTRMTYEIVREQLGQRHFFMKEDPRLRELDFGNFQDLETMEKTMETRKAYGRFWFRFMNGESGADVYDRATAFWESVFRSMDHSAGTRFQNYVIVTHGLMMRLILMRYFQWKVEFFERVWNPGNCETWVMERDERGSYRIVTEILDRPEPADVIAMEEANGQVEGASGPADAQDAPEDTSNDAAGGVAGQPGAGGSDECGAVAATAMAMAAASEAAGAAAEAGTPVARRKSSAQQQTLSPMLEEAMAHDDAQVEALLGGEGDRERRRSSSGASFSGQAAGERERATRQSTLEIPRPGLALPGVAGHVRGGGSSGSGVEAMGGLVYGLREERGDDGDVNVSKSRSAADFEAPSAERDGMLRRSGVSALNLRDGGFAPGEEGCGRDEEL